MRVPGELIQQIHRAVLDSFTSKAALAQMVRFHLDENLDEIVHAASLSETVFELIGWAESRNRLDALLRAARAENPDHKLLAHVQQQLTTLAAVDESISTPADQSPVAAPPSPKMPAWKWPALLLVGAIKRR